ncbi:MAG: hypothetical protein PHH35_01300 [Candidatus Pacebacteria bacterium]|nr:hypothetical protein [Candidatus Paceibacterota bacterium]
MNINKKIIIVLGTLMFLLIITFGGIVYYNEKKEQAQVFNIPDWEQGAISFSQNYPGNFNELINFVSACKNSAFSDIEGLRENETNELIYTMRKELRKLVLGDDIVLVNTYMPLFSPLDSIISFDFDQYIGTLFNLKGIIREHDFSLLGQDKLYFCSISEPSWIDPLYLQVEPNQLLIFDEGDVFCERVEISQNPFMVFSGFTPRAESLGIKIYLVNEQIVSDVMNKQSFPEIKELLKSYFPIWQLRKPITI